MIAYLQLGALEGPGDQPLKLKLSLKWLLITVRTTTLDPQLMDLNFINITSILGLFCDSSKDPNKISLKRKDLCVADIFHDGFILHPSHFFVTNAHNTHTLVDIFGQ